MKILIAPDKFKGSLRACEAADAIQKGVVEVFPDADCQVAPIADGGEGTMEAFLSIADAARTTLEVRNALGAPVEAAYVWLDQKRTAVIEMSQAAGLAELKPEQRNPMHTSTAGVGDLIRSAVSKGAKRILIGLGGSATNDAGCGMAAALGWKFLDAAGRELASAAPHDLQNLERITPPEKPVTAGVKVFGLCDVDSPLLGASGCSRVFAPQKGADDQMVDDLETVMGRVADVTAKATGISGQEEMPGAGSAGGLGFGLMAFAGAKLTPGFDAVAAALDLEQAVAACDLVLTAEGKLDGQTLQGKGPAGLARLARKFGKPVVAFAGMVEDQAKLHKLFDACIPIADRPLTLDQSREEAADLLRAAAVRAARLLRLGGKLC